MSCQRVLHYTGQGNRLWALMMKGTEDAPHTCSHSIGNSLVYPRSSSGSPKDDVYADVVNPNTGADRLIYQAGTHPSDYRGCRSKSRPGHSRF